MTRRLSAIERERAARFAADAAKLFPGLPERAMLARPHFLNVDHHTVTRMMDGRMEVTKRVEWAMYGMQMCKKHAPDRWRKLLEEG